MATQFRTTALPQNRSSEPVHRKIESRSGFQVPVEARRICLVRATSASDGFEGIAHERLIEHASDSGIRTPCALSCWFK